MDFNTAARAGALLSKPYARTFLRLLANYSDISASEAASMLSLHIQTAQDFLDGLADLGVAQKQEVAEGKRPHFRYSLKKTRLSISIDLESLKEDDAGSGTLACRIRERKRSGARFSTARSGGHLSAITFLQGRGRDAKERRINLTTAQGRFLYHLPFPDAKPIEIRSIMEMAGLGEDTSGEVLEIVELLEQAGVVELC
jgi:hypothetical protein